MQLFSSLLLLALSVGYGSGGRILAFFPFPWRSHNHVFQPLMKALALKGHEVHFYTALPVKDPPKGLIQYPLQDRHEEILASFDQSEFLGLSTFSTQRWLTTMDLAILETAIKTEKACQDLLNSNDTYDAVLTEFTLGGDALAYLAPKFKALSILVHALHDQPWFNEVSGLSDNPSYMVNVIVPYTDRMSFFERIYNMYTTLSVNIAAYIEVATRQQAFADKYIRYEGWENRPKLLDIVSDNALILMNSHAATSYRFPKAPHVKEVGGLHVNPTNQPLPKDLQDFMDDAPDGVIYFSLGSVIKPQMLVEMGKFDIFVKVFKSLKQKVMWKVGEGMPPVDDPKIKLQTWFPQQGILAHKNTKLFITHGGLQSMIETISNGVPCLGTPFLYDQEKDIVFLESVGMGRMLKFENLTEETLRWSINEVLGNPKYKERALKQRDLLLDRPMKPVDEAVYWIEYVMRHGKVLQPASVHMPLYKLFLLDIFGALLVLFALGIVAVKIICRFVLSLCTTSSVSRTNAKLKAN